VKPAYTGPNLIIVRFGGGVRRVESIDPDHTYAPYFRNELTKRGALFTNMEISQSEGVTTSHGGGTLYILTGRYDEYKDVGNKFLGQRFEARVPTVFEYLRKHYDVPEHETLIINGEDRTDEEFYTFSNHHLFGVNYRSNVLSLYRYKTYLLRQQLQVGALTDAEREAKSAELKQMEAIDYRMAGNDRQSPRIQEFWAHWRGLYGDSGFKNSRGDRLLTDLVLDAMRLLRPKLMMINFNDPDYVHWGNPSHYTEGIRIIDEGIRRLVDAVDADEAYRDRTVFAIVPDCGRDTNPYMAVEFQHHFGSKSSREIFAFLMGPGIAKGVVVDRKVDQIAVARTVGRLMGFEAQFFESDVLEEAFA